MPIARSGQEGPKVMLDDINEHAWSLLPGLLVVILGFEAGGFFPGTVGVAAAGMATLLAVRAITVRGGPRLGWTGAVSLLGLGLFAAWAYISKSWSHAPARALLVSDLDVLYLVTVAVFSAGPMRPRTVARGIAVGAFIVCGAGLLSRVLPQLVTVTPGFESARLSYPVTYWNALGLLASLAILVCVHLACEEDEPPLARAAWSALIPALAATLLFTFSRGAIAALIVMLVLYALLRPRLRVALAVPLIGVPTALALVSAYNASILASTRATTAAGVAQGHHVALLVAVAMGAAGALSFLSPRLAIPLERRPLPRRWSPALAAGGLLLIVLIAVLVHLPTLVSRDYHGFVNANVGLAGGTRARLGSASNNGRLAIWSVAWSGFQGAPTRGHGAGTFALLWSAKRPGTETVENAHSLYLETLDELGVVGLILLLCGILGLLAGAIRAWFSPGSRATAALAVAALVGWALHAGIDWDWQMPVVTAPALVLAAVAGNRAVSRRGSVRRWAAARFDRWDFPEYFERWPRGRAVLGRGLVAVTALVLAIAPLRVALSQAHISASVEAADDHDCARAVPEARAAISALGSRPEPYQVLGLCADRRGRWRAGVAEMRAAIARDPQAWEYHYGLALSLAVGRLNPRPALRVALRLDPREQILHNARSAFRTGGGQSWRLAAFGTGLAPP